MFTDSAFPRTFCPFTTNQDLLCKLPRHNQSGPFSVSSYIQFLHSILSSLPAAN